MFKHSYFNQRVRAAPYQAKRVRYWDRAATQDGGCYTAGTLLARSPEGNWYVENVVHGQWEPDTRDEQIVATALRDRSRYGPTHEPVIWIEQEPGSSGVDAYKHTARKLAGFHVHADRPTGSKEVRAEPWASQCAAKNVYLVADGTWDIPGWIDEHCLFPMSKFKDRVDSAAGAFARLGTAPPKGTVRMLSIGEPRPQGSLRIVVGSREQLAHRVIGERHVLVAVVDPPPVGKADPPPQPSDQLLGYLMLAFADLDPAEHQDTWGEPIPPYDQPAEQLLMTRELGKKFWSFLLRRRDPFPGVIVLQDDGDRRALSMAYGIVDVLGLWRAKTIYRLQDSEWRAGPSDQAPNRHVYEIMKKSRELVVG